MGLMITAMEYKRTKSDLIFHDNLQCYISLRPRKEHNALDNRQTIGMGDMGLKIYHDISGIYCDNDINDDNSGNPVSLEKSITFPIFTQNSVL